MTPKRAKQLGVTDLEYEAMLSAQHGVCAICGNPPKTRRLHVDHDHKTGVVRGLLCFRCNRALPAYATVEWMTNALLYLCQREPVDAAARPTAQQLSFRYVRATTPTAKYTVFEEAVSLLAVREAELDTFRAWVAEHLDALPTADDEPWDEDLYAVIESLRCIITGNPGCTEESDYTPEQWRVLQRFAALAAVPDGPVSEEKPNG